LRYFNQDQIIAGARSALKPTLLITMALTILVAVVIYGLFSIEGAASGFGKIFLRFVGGVGCLLSALFGLTALAYQVNEDLSGKPIPNTLKAMRFAWTRIKPLLLIPAWAVGGLLLLVLAEMLLFSISKIPALGLVWLALILLPLVLLNTVVAVALLLALFNIAARVAISEPDAKSLRETLWQLLRKRLPELLIYNLGGVLVTFFVAALVLSPLYLGWVITDGLAGYVASGEWKALKEASGFWGGIAYLVDQVMNGALIAVVGTVPGVVITHMTLLVHKELDDSPDVAKKGAGKAGVAAKKPAARRSASAKTSVAGKSSGGAGKKRTAAKPAKE
jgi:hypothetical protein